MEKIHGTSANLKYKVQMEGQPEQLTFFSGGEKHEKFKALFDEPALLEKFRALVQNEITVYGEAYGGKCQGMSDTYGKDLKFIVFDIRMGDTWLSVPDMASVATSLGLEVVHFEKVEATVEKLDALRDAPSVQAVRNGCGPDKLREGIVIRPFIELTKNNGERIIVKHKGEKFSERSTPQKVLDPAKSQALKEAKVVAQEWVTEMRLGHVLDKLPSNKDGQYAIEQMQTVLAAMVEDIYREAKGEIVESKDAEKEIRARTAGMFRQRLAASLKRP